jgi:hypothetical protein
MEKAPEYKTGGFFVFSDLGPGDYILQISGPTFQTQEHRIAIPFSTHIFDQPGDNDLVVVVGTVNGASEKITFDPVNLSQEIKAGALVRARGFSGNLARDLNTGEVSEARLDDVSGISAGDVLRIIQDKSVRLRFDPYVSLPAQVTRIAGKVFQQDAPEVCLKGAQIRLRRLNGVTVDLDAIRGARIASVDLAGSKVVLGSQRDITTVANSKGDYNLYFMNGGFFENVTLRVTMAGYHARTITRPVLPGQRTKIDFALTTA